jgi:hypothetical protein
LATPLRRDRALRTSTLSAAVGGALGLGIVTVHNLRVSGHLIQGSAQIKAHWGAVSGYHLLPPLDVAAKITSVGFLLLRTLDLGPLLFAVLVFAAIAVAAKVARSSDETPSELRSWLVMSAALIGAGYWAVYGANAAATQLWYSASFVIPAWIGSAALLERCRTKAGVRVATMGVAALALVGFIDARRPEWADRSLGPTAAAWVDRQVDGHRVGAWNAGVIGQFSKSQVINIDGLVNDEVQPYILTGVLQCYLFERNIDYVFDGDDMLTGPYPARGGYADGALRRALREKQRFISPDGAATRWMLYKVDRSALASSCSTARLSLLNPSAPFEPRHGQ